MPAHFTKSKNLSIIQTSTGKILFQKKPLGRRRHLMSSSIRGCEFSTVTSGTERKRGFVGIVPLPCANLQSFASTLPFYPTHKKFINIKKKIQKEFPFYFHIMKKIPPLKQNSFTIFSGSYPLYNSF